MNNGLYSQSNSVHLGEKKLYIEPQFLITPTPQVLITSPPRPGVVVSSLPLVGSRNCPISSGGKALKVLSVVSVVITVVNGVLTFPANLGNFPTNMEKAMHTFRIKTTSSVSSPTLDHETHAHADVGAEPCAYDKQKCIYIRVSPGGDDKGTIADGSHLYDLGETRYAYGKPWRMVEYRNSVYWIYEPYILRQ